jgi:DNA-binding response OmpR family regulator
VTAATPDVRIVDLDIDAYLTKPVARTEFVALVRSLVERDRLPDPVGRYVSELSKRAALLESKSRSVLQSDPTYVSFEAELSRLARRVDRRPDDPYLERVLPDGGRAGTSPGPTA